MQKIQKTIRIDDDLFNEIELYRKYLSSSFSSLSELALYDFMDMKPQKKYELRNDSEKKSAHITLCVSPSLYGLLIESTEKRNSTLSEEIRFRLGCTMENQYYDTIELKELFVLKSDLNRLGNLFKISINNNSEIDNKLLLQINDKLDCIKDELTDIRRQAIKR